MAKINMPDVVVLIPGITGSVLRKNGKVVWGYSPKLLGAALLTSGSNISRALALPQDSPDVDDLGDCIVADALIPDLHLLPGFWKIDGYSHITNELKNRFDLKNGENFFTFPYDWRRHNEVAARKLNRLSLEWLNNWRERSGNQDARLILIAHSMGGIVARYFLEVFEGWRNTKALITFGTPYRGSLNALDTLVNGVRKGPFLLDEITKTTRQFTSLYQLLPIYECYDNGSGDLSRLAETTDIPYVDKERAALALAFHREIETAVDSNKQMDKYNDRRHGYTVYPVVGIRQTTKQSAIWKEGSVEILTTFNGQDMGGDGTVPHVSAIPIEMSNNPSPLYAATKHGSLQNADAVIAHIEGILSGIDFDLGQFRVASGVQLALEIEDIYLKYEAITVRVRPTADVGSLTAILHGPSTNEQAASLPMRKQDENWHEATFPPQPAGGYQIEVEGEGVQTISDSFVVADIAAGEA